MPSGEISTEAVVRSALRAGKDVLVPYLYKILNAGKPKTVMDMVSLHSEVDYDALTPDKWGIPSVNPDSVSQRRRCLVVDNDDIDDDRGVALQTPLDVVIVPGVAFDQRLQRVGHGKGFYDSFFSSYRARLQSQAVESIHMPYLGKTSFIPASPSLTSRSGSSTGAASSPLAGRGASYRK